MTTRWETKIFGYSLTLSIALLKSDLIHDRHPKIQTNVETVDRLLLE